jgi:hypothetical protein
VPSSFLNVFEILRMAYGLSSSLDQVFHRWL